LYVFGKDCSSREGAGEHGGEMAQTMYAHMNKLINIKKYKENQVGISWYSALLYWSS
jgi:hypothetical protein